MKYTKLFEQFINESTNLPEMQEAETLTEHQLDIANNLADVIGSNLNQISVSMRTDGTIQISYTVPVHDWMELRVNGESVRMYLEQDIRMRPIFLSIAGNTEIEIKRMAELGLLPNLSDFLEIDDEYITGFNVFSGFTYWSKDVQFDYSDSTALEFFSAAYLDVNNNGPQELEEVAEQLADTITDWLGEMAIPESALQEMLDEQFGSDDEATDDEADEGGHDENDDTIL